MKDGLTKCHTNGTASPSRVGDQRTIPFRCIIVPYKNIQSYVTWCLRSNTTTNRGEKHKNRSLCSKVRKNTQPYPSIPLLGAPGQGATGNLAACLLLTRLSVFFLLSHNDIDSSFRNVARPTEFFSFDIAVFNKNLPPVTGLSSGVTPRRCTLQTTSGAFHTLRHVTPTSPSKAAR